MLYWQQMNNALLRTRLSWFFVAFLLIYFDLAMLLKGVAFTPAALTLFSVNSFLYGFYISPVLAAQRARIDDLAKIIRAEANALFDVLIKTKKLPRKSRNHLQDLIEEYLHASFRERKPTEGEDEYEAIISYCLEYHGKDPETIEKILNGLVANQQNRSQLAQQLGNKVFSNEWMIMLVLFSITVSFVILLDIKASIIMSIVKALLCTGLTMLMINLLKLSTLTHKKSRHIWDPLDKLATSRFRRID
jgi:hypothetical protein